MVELRYINRPVAATHLGDNIFQMLPILQVRYQQNIEELGMQEPIWGDWMDVPLVEEA